MLLRLATLIGLVALVEVQGQVARPGLSGYSLTVASGDCPGNEISRGFSLRQCGQDCTNSPACLGFVYDFGSSTCSLKSQECLPGFAIPNANKAFYLKGEIACSANNKGKKFVFAFMTNRVAQPKNMDLEMFVTHSNDRPITVRMSTADGGASDSKVVGTGRTVETFKLPHTYKMRDLPSGGIVVEDKGVILESDDEFVMYGVNKEFFTTDAWLGLPEKVLGQEYYASCHHPPFYLCEMIVVAAFDDTRVEIKLPRSSDITNDGVQDRPTDCSVDYQGRNYRSGQTVTMTLRKGQVMQMQAKCDLSGSFIKTTHPAAFFSGNARSNVGADTNTRDHLVEQMPPVSAFGTECFGITTPGRTIGDYWTVVAASDNTQVVVTEESGNERRQTLNAGQTWRFKNEQALTPTEGKVLLIRSQDKDHPFMAVSYVHSQVAGGENADPASILCTPAEQFGFDYTFLTPTGVATSYENHVTVVIQRGAENGLILDGRPIVWNSDWRSIPGKTDLISAWVTVNSGAHTIDHNDRSRQFGAYIYGAGDRESYGFPTGRPGLAGAPGRPGAPGPRGAQGDPGFEGPRGPKGFPGAPGRTGQQSFSVGKTGPVGAVGEPGPVGPRGSPGDAGPRGPSGNPGTDGTNGLPGGPGPNGMPGCDGGPGRAGAPGPSGRPGNPGGPGGPGDRGEPGIISRTGLPGDKGFPGRPGDSGSKGFPGIGRPGDRGAPGDAGFPGRDGVPGTPGFKGEPGVGEATPGLPGDRGIPGRPGTSGIPGGPGDRGIPGRPGRKGQPGIGGVSGVQISGDKGNKGQPGRPGGPGTPGIRGPPGIKGALGDSSFGQPGPPGNPGRPGLSGPKGRKGLTPVGQTGVQIGLPGDTGTPGRPGQPGRPGPPGFGTAGFPGPKGLRGESGLPGRDGTPGIPGQPGLRGREGDPGPGGPPGVSVGLEGPPGFKGPKGFPGQPGNSGLPGTPGGKGFPGLPGDPGETLTTFGTRGPKGFPGNDLIGNTGQPGPSGFQGPPGPPGPPGGPGIRGMKGPRGPKGIKGDRGSVVQGCLVVDTSTLYTMGEGPEGRESIQRGLHALRRHIGCVLHVSERQLLISLSSRGHSQSTTMPSCPQGHTKLWDGFSLLHIEDEGRAKVQDLGYSGSCLRQFDANPFLFCGSNQVCNWGMRTSQTFWLATGQRDQDIQRFGGGGFPGDNPLGTDMFNGRLANAFRDSEQLLNHISRCTVCMAPAPVIARHSMSNQVPSCPVNVGGSDYGRWESLWEGYSFVMHAIGSMGGGQGLHSPGSCLKEFRHNVYIECEVDGTCHYFSDSTNYWLFAFNQTSPRFSRDRQMELYKREDAPRKVGRCRVCAFRPNRC